MIKKITTTFILFIFSTQVFAQDLKSSMRLMSRNLRAVSGFVRKGDNSSKALEKIIELKQATSDALKYLPKGIDPSDSVAVDRYTSLIEQALKKIDELEATFLTSPLDKAQAKLALDEINSLRKQGHSIFK